ncbi:MAG: HI0074 family nucleotidyltransferase substrate-binding subunit [Motiliproteus sp.]
MSLILTPLAKAVASLENAIAQPKNEFIRDAVIQRFEYTYELCWKMLRRQLAEDQGDSAVKLLSRKELFRMAAEYEMLNDPVAWFKYHKARNETSLLYDQTKAEEVYLIAIEFSEDARKLLQQLLTKNRD